MVRVKGPDEVDSDDEAVDGILVDSELTFELTKPDVTVLEILLLVQEEDTVGDDAEERTKDEEAG